MCECSLVVCKFEILFIKKNPDFCIIFKKSVMILKGQSETVKWMTDSAVAKRKWTKGSKDRQYNGQKIKGQMDKWTNNDLQNITQKNYRLSNMQGHLNCIIGPRQRSALGPYLHYHSMSIELNIYLLYWYFYQNQCSSIKKHAVHNIHRLTWAPRLMGPQATAQRTHALRRHWQHAPH
jgi:hypothetical protein